MRGFSLATVASLIGVVGVGCGTSGGNLKLKVLDSVTHPPANVALYFSVSTKAGAPISDLQPAAFHIYEDGKLVPEKKGKRALLDPRVAEAQYTLVLVDMSGPVVDSEDLPELVKSVTAFVERLGRAHHDVAVSVFDGGNDLVPMFGFGAEAPKDALEAMGKYRPRDRNGNLNGAVFQGIGVLEKQMASSAAAHRLGTLVVFTDRGDLAHKVGSATVGAALDKTPADVYLIATGENLKKAELANIARTDAFYSNKPSELTVGFTQLGKHLETVTAGRYVLSYCSPKRKGEHDLEVEVVTDTESGRLTNHFSAKGFKKGCSPKRHPAFVPKDDKGEAADDGGSDKGDEKADGKSDDRSDDKGEKGSEKDE
jgi:hypothetical protein